jgi:hypothetical protein
MSEYYVKRYSSTGEVKRHAYCKKCHNQKKSERKRRDNNLAIRTLNAGRKGSDRSFRVPAYEIIELFADELERRRDEGIRAYSSLDREAFDKAAFELRGVIGDVYGRDEE